MRVIKFRAWQPHNSLHRKPGIYEVRGLEFYESEGHGEAFLALPGEDAKSSEYLDDIVLMQYTGLKDKNGVEIWEGDVVDTRYGRMTVRWNEYQSGFDPFRGDINCPDAETESEVIGNIYENPELLKEAA